MASEVTWQSNPPEKLLKERFHISTGFHPGQREIIEQLLQGKRLLVIQRTGWGKSLCYQLASLYYPHLTLVFSPLKALMRDQCQRCNAVYAIPAAIVSSEFSLEENRATLMQAVERRFKVLFIAPERLDNADWQSLALTATANRRVEDDALRQIGSGVQVVRGTMQRPNLYLNVEQLHGDREKLAYLAELLPRCPGTGIIYTATRHDAEMSAAFLRQQGIQAEYYHAGREEHVRQEIEQKLMANQYRVVCATNALGMGIDKPDLRFIIHYQIPGSPISYYQEIGRAGRDGKVAWCILLYDPADLKIQEHFIQNAKPEGKCYEIVLSLLRKHPEGLRESDVMRVTGFSQNTVRSIFVDLEDQGLIRRDSKNPIYIAVARLGQVDFSAYDTVRLQKQHELSDIQIYAQLRSCYMEYLTTYLGDQGAYQCRSCGQCRASNFPIIRLSERMLAAATHFLEEEFLPRIEKRGTEKRPIHEAGWSLSYHGITRIGRLVRASKPPTRSGMLVETFARQVAIQLDLEYVSVLVKVRQTQEQKSLSNWLQKKDNVKDAFTVRFPEQVAGRTLLLIDDIYDSGYMLREVGQTLMQAGARAVYPLTITRTAHSDDQ